MNRSEYLLTCLAEECDEVGQRVMKALRFSLSETQAGQPLNNADRIAEEFADLCAVYVICQNEGLLPAPTIDPDRKLAKIERFMSISREHGALTSQEQSR